MGGTGCCKPVQDHASTESDLSKVMRHSPGIPGSHKVSPVASINSKVNFFENTVSPPPSLPNTVNQSQGKSPGPKTSPLCLRVTQLEQCHSSDISQKLKDHPTSSTVPAQASNEFVRLQLALRAQPNSVRKSLKHIL